MILKLHELVNTSRLIIYKNRRWCIDQDSIMDQSQQLDAEEKNIDMFVDGDFLPAIDELPEYELVDDNDFSAFSDIRPIRLDHTDFDYQNFYKYPLLQHYFDYMSHPCMFGVQMITSCFTLPDGAACNELFDFIINYLGRYDIYPEIIYHESNVIQSIHVRWLGGCLAERVLDKNLKLTNDVVCFLNEKFY